MYDIIWIEHVCSAGFWPKRFSVAQESTIPRRTSAAAWLKVSDNTGGLCATVAARVCRWGTGSCNGTDLAFKVFAFHTNAFEHPKVRTIAILGMMDAQQTSLPDL